MPPMAPTAVCSRCIFALGRRPVPRSLAHAGPGLPRFLSRQAKVRPSRMVLANQVYRTPAGRDRRRPSDDGVDGPFAGMNRRVANVRPRRAPVVERRAERGSSSRRSADRLAERLTERRAERRAGGSGAERSMERSAGRSTARSMERGTARSMERSTPRSTERSTPRSMERSTERSTARSTARGAERLTGRPTERRAENRGPPRRDGERRLQDDRKALNMQRALATVPYGLRMTIKERMLKFDSFDQFDLLPSLKAAVSDELFQDMIDIRPTPVQRLAIPALLGQPSPELPKRPSERAQSFLLAAETGSGKTLAYLLPAIDALKIAEAEDADIKAYKERQQRLSAANPKAKPFDEPHPTMARPRVVVLVPTAELAEQVMGVSKKLSHVVKFKTEMLSADLKPQQIQRNLYGPKGLDVIVSTPHLLASIADSDPNILARVTHLVVDEADSLLDRSFAPVTTSIIQRARPSLKQLVCCSATIPTKLNNHLASAYPNMIRITTPNLHAIPRRVQLGVIDVSKDPYRNNKDLACAEAIYSIGKEASLHELPAQGEMDVRRILVFVNEREKTEKVAEFLRSRGIDAEALHRDATEKRQGETLQAFTTSEPLRVPAPPSQGRKRPLNNIKVLVATDIASRGIDTVPVRYVILYDVPHTTIDFIHRLGRAGRMGRRGRGVVLVGNGDRRDVVAEVKRTMFMGQALI